MPWYRGNNSKKDRAVVRCYYVFNSRKDIGPAGGQVMIEPGVYWTNAPFPAIEAQSDKALYKLANGTFEQGRPHQAVITGHDLTWLMIAAKPLNWGMVD